MAAASRLRSRVFPYGVSAPPRHRGGRYRCGGAPTRAGLNPA
jgi:hypothetical protein